MKKQKVYMEGAEVFGGLLPPPGHRYVTVDGCGPRKIEGNLCMGTGVSIFTHDLEVERSYSFKHYSPFSTNILAEFLAIRDALKICLSMKDECEWWGLWSDNRYAVDAFNNIEVVRLPHLLAVKREWLHLKEDIRWKVRLNWLPAKNNWSADLASRKITEFLSEGT